MTYLSNYFLVNFDLDQNIFGPVEGRGTSQFAKPKMIYQLETFCYDQNFLALPKLFGHGLKVEFVSNHLVAILQHNARGLIFMK
jgi:hypothetical protein